MAHHLTKHALQYALKKGGEAVLKSAAKKGIKTVAKEIHKSNSNPGFAGIGAIKIARPVTINSLQYIVLPNALGSSNASTITEDCKIDNKQDDNELPCDNNDGSKNATLCNDDTNGAQDKLDNTSPQDADLSVHVGLYIIDSQINYNALKRVVNNKNGMHEYEYKCNDINYKAIFNVLQDDCVKVTISQLKLCIKSTITVNDIREHIKIVRHYLVEQIQAQNINANTNGGMNKSNDLESDAHGGGNHSDIIETGGEEEKEEPRLFDLVYNGNILLNNEDKLVSAVDLNGVIQTAKKYTKVNIYKEIEMHAVFVDGKVVTLIEDSYRSDGDNNNDNITKTIEEKISDCNNDDYQNKKIPKNVQCLCGCHMVPTTPQISSLSKISDINILHVKGNCKRALPYHCWMYGCQNENKINHQDIMFECRNYKFHNYASARTFNNNNKNNINDDVSITLCLTCARFVHFLKESLDKDFVSMRKVPIESKFLHMMKFYGNILIDQVSNTHKYGIGRLNLDKNFKQTVLLNRLLLDYTKTFNDCHYSLKINAIKTAKRAMSKCIITTEQLMCDYRGIDDNLTPSSFKFVSNVDNLNKSNCNVWFIQIVNCICKNKFLLNEILKKQFDNACKKNVQIRQYIKEYEYIMQQLLINKLFVIINPQSHQWVKDSSVKQCNDDKCQIMFGLTNRKHHCRVCGCIVCSKHIIDRQCKILDRDGHASFNNVVDSLQVIRMCKECSKNKVSLSWFGATCALSKNVLFV